jgi:hypothetical protein
MVIKVAVAMMKAVGENWVVGSDDQKKRGGGGALKNRHQNQNQLNFDGGDGDVGKRLNV